METDKNQGRQRPKTLKHVVCPQCGKEFVLTWDDFFDKKQSLFVDWCPSGGIYAVYIACPHCAYEEPL